MTSLKKPAPIDFKTQYGLALPPPPAVPIRRQQEFELT